MFDGSAERRSGFKQIDLGLGGRRGHAGISDNSFRVIDVISGEDADWIQMCSSPGLGECGSSVQFDAQIKKLHQIR